jgi:hypothetical protein
MEEERRKREDEGIVDAAEEAEGAGMSRGWAANWDPAALLQARVRQRSADARWTLRRESSGGEAE